MPADLTLLAPAFQDQVRIMLDACAQQGYILRPSEGLRDPYKQAIYWRQSPSIEQIEQKIASLEAAQLGFWPTACASSVQSMALQSRKQSPA